MAYAVPVRFRPSVPNFKGLHNLCSPFLLHKEFLQIITTAKNCGNFVCTSNYSEIGATDMSKKYKDCWKPEKHPKHMCKLFKKGMMMEIDQHSANPTVACAKCGAKSDVSESVCQPKPI